MKQLYLLVSMVLLVHVGAMAQRNELSASTSSKQNSNVRLSDQALLGVTGRVTDETGAAFPGVNVLVKGSTSGQTTDANGKYTVEVPDGNSVLVFSFVGYATQEISVGGRTTIDVKMALDVQSLNEVVVTALGIPKESKKLGYSATTAKVGEMQQNRTNNMMSALEGKIAGLDISPPSAGPAASNKIRIRGQTAFAGSDNGPLLIINGLPMSQGANPANGGASRDGGDNFMLFNPDDVESMTVLKGATAAALYGSRASNGAIVITTKNGSGSKGIGVEFTSNMAIDEILDFTDFQYEYGQGQNGARPGTVLGGSAAGSGQFGWGERYDDAPTPTFDGTIRPYSPHKNYVQDFFRTGVTSTNTIAVSNSSDKGSFRASYSTTNAQGITPNNEYKRRIFNLNANQKFGEKLTVQTSVNYTNEDNRNRPQVGVQGQGYMNFLIRMSPTVPLWAFKEGAFTPAGAERPTNGFNTTILNPYFYLPSQFDVQRDERLLGTVMARYQFAKWLYFQGRVNGNFNFNNSESNNPTGGGGYGTANDGVFYDATRTTYNGQYNVSNGSSYDMNYEGILGGSHTFGDLSVDAFIAGNMRSSGDRSVNANAQAFQTKDIYTLSNGTVFGQGQGYGREEINSVFGSAEFGWKGIVYVNLTGRQDWFSRLTPGKGSNLAGNNSYFYPSISGSFIFSELLEDKLPWLNYGKLRSSWADVGAIAGINTFGGTVGYSYSTQQYLGRTIGSVSGNVPNANLSPYSVQEKEIGLELRMFNNRVTTDIAVYKKVTTDQILSVATSTASGTGSVSQNVASLQNQGIEFLVDVAVVKAGNFSWNSAFNTAYNISEVTNLGGNQRLLITDWGNSGNEFIGKQYYEVGKPLAQIGARTYPRDANGNVLLTGYVSSTSPGGRLYIRPGQEDVLFGGALPLYTGGWNNTFRYKNLSLLVHFDYKAGGKLISGTQINGLRQGHSKASLEGRRDGESGIIFDGVYVDGPRAGEQNTTAVYGQQFYADYRNHQIADPFVHRSDYIKLRNITLTYDLTSLVSSKLNFVKGLTLSASCRNVALLKKYVPDLDPEATASAGDQRAGYESLSLPTSRLWGFNVNMKF